VETALFGVFQKLLFLMPEERHSTGHDASPSPASPHQADVQGISVYTLETVLAVNSGLLQGSPTAHPDDAAPAQLIGKYYLPTRAILQLDLDGHTFSDYLKKVLVEWGHPLTVACAFEIVRYAEERLAHLASDSRRRQATVQVNPAMHTTTGLREAFAIVADTGPPKLVPSQRFHIFLRGSNEVGEMEPHTSLKWHSVDSDMFYAEMSLPGLITNMTDDNEYVAANRTKPVRSVMRFEIIRTCACELTTRQVEALGAHPGKSARARR
jgi:hypothetical protein